jgi:hypothetical protein
MTILVIGIFLGADKQGLLPTIIILHKITNSRMEFPTKLPDLGQSSDLVIDPHHGHPSGFLLSAGVYHLSDVS